MDEEQNNLEKQKQADNNQKTAHVAGKAAATYYGGAAGGQLYDAASKTKVGQAIEKNAAKNISNNPALNRASQKLNDVGAMDAADKGIDLAGGSMGKGAPNPSGGGMNKPGLSPSTGSEGGKPGLDQGNKTSNSGKSSNSNTNTSGGKKKLNNLFGSGEGNADSSDSSTENESYASKIFKFIKSHPKPFISMGGGFLLILVLIIAVISIADSVVGGVIDFFNNIKDTLIGFFTKDEEELMNDYYDTLKNTQIDINEDYSVCIDVNLITAALTVNVAADDFVNDGEQIDPSGDGDTTTNEDGTQSTKPYKKMTKQVKLLAYMQLMTSKYGLDKSYKETNGSYCSSDNNTPVLVDSSKVNDYEGEKTPWVSIDSSNFDLISRHDLGENLNFKLLKTTSEKNYAYYLYYPKYNSDGSCDDSYAKGELPEEKKELSIGDLKTKEDSVFYWNLINSFIPDYYKDYLPDKDAANYDEAVKKIADDIYLLYAETGPSQTCASSYQGPSSLCPNGITVVGKDGNASTIDFEEYIAGVVSNEAYSSEGMEALKAQAVAARTYAINLTNYCEKTISNSTNAQTFTKDINDRAREAATSTAGEILVDSNGKIFGAQYDSFCYDDKDCPDAKKNADGTYSVTYTKVPNGEKHVITLSDPKQYGRITHGQGHAHGMSQLLSYQMAKEGKTYQEILSYFYSDGVTINLVLSPTTTESGTIINKPIEHYLSAVGTNINNMNQTIYSQVRKAGVGTREGVVAAAVTLINNFYSQTGYLLPYELYPSGKYSGYGMDPSWGTNTGRSDYPSNGLDCSGFVSWAIHNGGFKYEVKNAKGWGDSSARRPWTKGMTDTSAKPGDLIYNAPQSANGTTGHIRMIVEVTKEGYVVAEASSRKNGVRIKTISFTSTGNYYLVNMDNYYASATKVTDYPQ